LSLLARIGTSQPVEAVASLDALADGFDFAHFGRAPAHFDLHDVELLNARLLHMLDFGAVQDRLPAGASEADWLLVRPNLESLSDFDDWYAVLHGDYDAPALHDDDRAFLQAAADVGEPLDWTDETWRQLTGALKEATGRKGKALFHPLRLALTGRESGPEMAGVLERMGKDRALHRLRLASHG
jgi:glutamyl-tRNA synthetase